MKKLFLKLKKPNRLEIKKAVEKAIYTEHKQRLNHSDYQDVYDVFRDLSNNF